MSDNARAGASSAGDPLTVPAEEATLQHAEAPTDAPSIHEAPISDPDPVVADPAAASAGGPDAPPSTQAGALGGLIPEDRPELLLAASLAGGVLAAIALRTLVRR